MNRNVAIIGIGCRFPDAKNQYDFFDNICKGLNAVKEITPDRWDVNQFFDDKIESSNKSVSKWCAMLEDITGFDNRFFNLSPREALQMDPEQRILLECAYHSIENSGLPLRKLQEDKTSVFIGAYAQDFLHTSTSYDNEIDSYSGVGTFKCMQANRISHTFGFTGKSLTIDTACASSMVAVHEACQSIISGESQFAIAGGIGLAYSPWHHVVFSKARMLSPDGQCKTFDKDANGFVPGEGVGLLILQPLDQAIKQNNHIYGVIKGSAVNHVGKTRSITAPDALIQEELIRKACQKANINAASISFIEAHGTGTSLGDPIEVEALTKAFKQDTRDTQFCHIGSVKTNIGHLEAAAGIAGLIKVLMMMRYKKIPPTININTINPLIDFENSPFVLSSDLQNWTLDHNTKTRRAGISSLGMGGVNSHIIIEEYLPKTTLNKQVKHKGEVFTLSAKTEASLQGILKDWDDFVLKPDLATYALPDICATLARRENYKFRFAVLASTKQELLLAIKKRQTTFSAINQDPSLLVISKFNWGGYKEIHPLLSSIPALKEKIDQLFTNFPSLLGIQPLSYYFKRDNWGQHEELFSFVVAYAYLKTLEEWGFRPDKITADKNGILLAAAFSGMIEVKDILHYFRNKKSLKNITLQRPRIPFFDQVSKQTILPHAYSTAFLKELIHTENLDPNIVSKVYEKGLLLKDNQYTYKKFTEEWNTILDKYGKDINQMVQQAIKGNAGNPLAPKEHLLSLLIVKDSLNRLNNRWKLTSNLKIQNDNFQCLLFFIRTGLITKEGLVELCLDENVDWATMAASLSKKQKHIKEEPFQDFCTDYLPEIDNSSLWLQGYSEIRAMDFEELPLVYFRENDLIGEQNLTIRPPKTKMDVYNDVLNLYQFGVNVNWEKIYTAPFSKVALPSYFFDKKKFAIRTVPFSTPQQNVANIPNVQTFQSQGLVFCPDWEIDNTQNTRKDKRQLIVASHDVDLLNQAKSQLNQQLAPLISAIYQPFSDIAVEQKPDQILLLSPLKTEGQSTSDFLKNSIMATFELTKKILAEKIKKPVEILITAPPQDVISYPFYAAVNSFGKTIKLENPRITIKILGIETNDTSTIFAAIANELNVDAPYKKQIKYLKNKRYTKKLQPKQLASQPLSFRDGSYLIIGGFGGIGLQLAKHFFPKRSTVQIVLVGRSAMTADHEKTLRELNATGLSISYKSADVSKKKATKLLLNTIRKEFGPLKGIFHAAGVLRDTFFIQKNSTQIETVLAPKVKGTINLNQYSKNDKLDYFVCFSSVVAEFGNVGQSDYAYANSFMDHYMQQREQAVQAGQCSGKSYSINWPLWEAGGMQIEGEGSIFNTHTGMSAMPVETGIQFLTAVLHQKAGQYIYCHGDTEKISAFVAGNTQNKIIAATTAAETKSVSKEQIKELLKHIFAEILLLDSNEIEADVLFEEYGVDSIMINQFNQLLESKIGSVSKTLLFEYHNINELAECLFTENKEAFLPLLAKNDSPKQAALSNKMEEKTLKTEEKTPQQREQPPLEQSKAYTEKLPQKSKDIAIIGVSGRYPMAKNLDAFWENLAEGKDCVVPIPKERWDFEKELAASKGQSYCAWGGFLEDADKFDPLFFRISPGEAELMDPQERLFLETAWHTIEDARYTPKQLSATKDGKAHKVGVFAGVTTLTHSLWGPDAWRQGDRSVPKDLPWSVANRVSYALNFKGPSMSVDTACASSLTAIHLACESIKNGECTTALAGGVNLYLHPSKYEWLCQMNMLSKNGRCHTFSKQADGFVPGEGVGAILLKPLAAAERDGDHIYGIIKGTAVNHGGHTHGYTVPSPDAQASLVVDAITRAKIDPNQLSYIEAHGTGTSLGDPIEISGLNKAFQTVLGDQFQKGKKYGMVGSVKSNIGHLEAAAGIAGVTKILLQMKHKTLVPSLHAEQLNPKIDFENACLEVQTQKTPWNADKAIAGISSFGAGGANAHVILSDYPNPVQQSTTSNEPRIFILSAKNEKQLAVYAEAMRQFIQQSHSPFSDICYSLQVSRVPMEERIAFVATDRNDLLEKLMQFVNENIAGSKSNHIKTGQRLSDIDYTKEALEQVFLSKDLKRLAHFWMHGAKVNWQQLYAQQPNRIQLPLYPFSRERYWIMDSISPVKDMEYKEKASRIHPLIHTNVSDDQQLKFESELLNKEFYLDDHFVINQPILPAVAYLEMARVAVEEATGQKVHKIKSNAWPNPILGISDEIKVETVINETKKGWAYQVSTEGKVCGQGLAILKDADLKAEYLDLDAIQKRCTDAVDRTLFYQKVFHIGLKLGKSFQLLQSINFGETEAFSTIELADHLAANYDEYGLHPAVLDASLQSLMGLLDRHGLLTTLNIPFSIGEVEIFSTTIPKKCLTYIEMKHGASKTFKKFQITLADTEGKVLVKVKDLVPRPFLKAKKESANSQVQLLLTPTWDKGLAPVINRPAPKQVLLFDEGKQLQQELSHILSNGYTGKTSITLVQKGNAYERINAHEYRINPSKKEDYTRLVTALEQDGLLPEKIVHFWSNEDNSPINTAFYSALYLLQTLLQNNSKQRFKWIWAYAIEQQNTAAYSAFYGLSKTIAKEYPNQQLKTLGIKTDASLAQNLAQELRNEQPEEWEVRYEKQQRLVKKWASLQLPNANIESLKLDSDAAIIITGGAGGIGLKVAEWLAAENKCKLVLLGRTALNKEKQLRIDALQNTGAQVSYHQVDISKKNELQQLLTELKAVGKIQGVIHAAGVLRDAYLRNKTKADCQAVFEAKITGLDLLDEVLAEESLDFFVLFSAAAAILGNAGQADYAYANAYMDAFAAQRNHNIKTGTRQGHTISINWPLWENGGMQLNQDTLKMMERSLGLTPMSDQAGKKVLAYALSTSVDQILYVEGHSLPLSKQLELVALDEPIKSQAVQHKISDKINEPILEQKTLDPDKIRQLFEKELIAIISPIIKLAPNRINPRSELSAFGFDSVSFTKLANQLNETFDLDLTPAIFFEFQTAEALIDFVLEDHRDILNKYYKNEVAVISVETKSTVPAQKTQASKVNNLSQLLKDELIAEVSALVKLDKNRINIKTNLGDYGFNSINFTKLANELNEKYELDLTPAIFFEYGSILEIQEHLLEEYKDNFQSHYASHSTTETTTESVADMAEASIAQGNKNYVSSSPSFSEEITNSAIDPNAIAIIGMAAKLPQSSSIEEFWDNILQGKDLITEIPKSRWHWKDIYGDPLKEPNKTNIKWGGFIKEDAGSFDAGFFGISPREAALMDPQQRYFLQIVYQTIEDAGYKPSDLTTQKTGLYVGVSAHDYYDLMQEQGIDIEAYTTTGYFHSILANRVSYLLNLKGPSFPIDTACSSSLVALRSAVEAIRTGSCEMAVVGAVSLLLSPNIFISFNRAGMLSLDGRCKTFDESANGYVRGEGIGAVLLKPLAKAIADRDNIHGVIIGSAVNHGGKVNTMTSPNPNAQSELIKMSINEANINPATISYMEAHGTGTSLGDPIEINGLKRAFKELYKEKGIPKATSPTCGIGSVKTNIGHLETCAGLAGMFKVLQGMKNEKLPPTIHIKNINPYLKFDGSPFYIVQERQEWKRLKDENGAEIPRRAGVSSFGFGGTNGHVLLEEFQWEDKQRVHEQQQRLFILSAKSKARLRVYVQQYIDFLEKRTSRPISKNSGIPSHKLVPIIANYLGVSLPEVKPKDSLEDLGIDLVQLVGLLAKINQQEGMTINIETIDNLISVEQLANKISTNTASSTPLKQLPSLAEITYTLQVGRAEMEERLAIVIDSEADLLDQLQAFISNSAKDSIFQASVDTEVPPIFSAQEVNNIETFLLENNLKKLADAWTKGTPVEWTKLYSGQTPVRVSIPTYPFSQKRHWLPENKKKKPTITEKKHPLVDRLVAEASLSEGLVFEAILQQSALLLSHHVVAGKVVLPGVAYLEMAREVLSRLGEIDSYSISNVVWLQTMKIEQEKQPIRIKLNKGTTTFSFEIYSIHPNGDTLHCKGDFIAKRTATAQVFNLNNLKKETSLQLTQQQIYQQFEQIQLHYGPYYNGIKAAYTNASTALAVLDISPACKQELDTLAWHPTIMDAALQAIATIDMPHKQGQQTRLPFYVEKIEQYQSLDTVAYIYVKREQSNAEVFLLDKNGTSLLRLFAVRVREINEKVADMFYRPKWVTAPLPNRMAERPATNTLIVYYKNEILLAKQLAKSLKSRSISLLKLGSKNKAINARHLEIDALNILGLKEFLQKMPAPDSIYFLANSQGKDLKTMSASQFDQQQQLGIFSFFELIKTVSSLDLIQGVKQIKLLLHNVQGGLKNTRIEPVNGSLLGFSKSLAKEYAHIALSCVTLCTEEGTTNTAPIIADTIQQLIQEPAHKKGEEIAYYKRHRLLKQLIATTLKKTGTSAFKQGGSYLIIGGAGGIGFALAQYLSKNYQARIILTGRRKQDQPITDKLQAIENLGGQARYFAADINNLESTKEVIQKTKASYRNINGIIHSAIVLDDKIIERMEKTDLQHVMAPKGVGIFNLQKATEGEALDFMLFFSSVQSFTGSLGQSSYAAACSLKDALSLAIDQQSTPTKVINWGYWGSVGIVASEAYRKTVEAQGYQSIEIAEGMDAIESVLRSPYPQIIALKANEKVLSEIGVQQGEVSPLVSSISNKSTTEKLPKVAEMPQAQQFEQGLRNLEKFGQLLVLKVFQEMGVFKQANQKYLIKELLQNLQVQPEFRRLFLNLLKILSHAEFVKGNNGHVHTTSKIEHPTTLKVLTQLEQREQVFFKKYPYLQAFAKLQATCIRHYPEVLKGKTLSTDIIFPNASMDLVTDIYKNNPLADYSNENVGKAVKAYIEDKLPQLRKGEKIRILEVGAGTGGTTDNVLKTIDQYREHISYLYTDISPRFLAYGKKHYGSRYPFMEFKLLNIEQQLAEQDYQTAEFDLILGANVFHATRDMQHTLANTNALLKPNGWLVLNEATTLMEFHSLVFGMLSGWWLHKNDSTRISGSPLLTLESWKQHLAKQGFDDLTTLGNAPDGLQLIHQVIIGKKSRDGSFNNAPKTEAQQLISQI